MSIPELRLKFGQRLRQWRLKRKLTQQQLADKVGIDFKYLQRIEGKKPNGVGIDMIARFAKALKIKPSSLIE